VVNSRVSAVLHISALPRS